MKIIVDESVDSIGGCHHHSCSEEICYPNHSQQTKINFRLSGAQAGQTRGAVGLSLIFFVTFFHQGKKVREEFYVNISSAHLGCSNRRNYKSLISVGEEHHRCWEEMLKNKNGL